MESWDVLFTPGQFNKMTFSKFKTRFGDSIAQCEGPGLNPQYYRYTEKRLPLFPTLWREKLLFWDLNIFMDYRFTFTHQLVFMKLVSKSYWAINVTFV